MLERRFVCGAVGVGVAPPGKFRVGLRWSCVCADMPLLSSSPIVRARGVFYRCVALMFGVFGLSSGGVKPDMFAQSSGGSHRVTRLRPRSVFLICCEYMAISTRTPELSLLRYFQRQISDIPGREGERVLVAGIRFAGQTRVAGESRLRREPSLGGEGRPKLAFPALCCGIAPDSFVIEITDFGLAPPSPALVRPFPHQTRADGAWLRTHGLPSQVRHRASILHVFSSDFSSIFCVR